jgi:hypothetical protein
MTGDDRLRPLDVIELGPAAARLAALASLRAAGWATATSLAGWRRVGRAVRDGESPAELFDDVWNEARGAARGALGITAIEETLGRLTSGDAEAAAPPPVALRERGAELLDRSAELHAQEDGTHPAFGVVLEELAPDELRILRVLAYEGDQAIGDVEASGPLGAGSTTVLRRRSLIASVAGCLRPERIQIYLDNLLRLGLARITDEPLDEGSYDVLEAQPDVNEALEERSGGTRRAKLVPQRLELTDFGRRFCEACVPDR